MDADLADVDGDGQVDVLFANNLDESTTIWWGERGRLPRSHTEVRSGRHVGAPAVSDVDSDGNSDLIIPLFNDARIAVVRGLGGRSFAPAFTVLQDPAPYRLTAADIDDDSLPDVVLTTMRDPSVYLRRGLRSESYLARQELLTLAPNGTIGRILPTRTGVRVWFVGVKGVEWRDVLPSGSTGSSTFQALPWTPSGVVREAGRSDGALAIVEQPGSIVLVRVGSDVQTPCVLASRGAASRVHVAGDIDGDGVVDLVESRTCEGCESNHVFVRGER
jgi:hypothetical protein